MPELPEVEVTRQGISPFMNGQAISKIIVRNSNLRWPIPVSIHELHGETIYNVARRGKYLLFETDIGTAILHLGMSGSLRILDIGTSVNKHDHLDIELGNGKLLRLNDPRRFGAFLWTKEPWQKHKLINKLGPEPFDTYFDGDYLYQLSRKRKQVIKSFIMNGHVVVGAGNIYANEALFSACINPHIPAKEISLAQYQRLAYEIKKVLTAAIKQGGTTLKDFTSSDGKPGYFAQQLNVYGLSGKLCRICGDKIQLDKIANRATYSCLQCQPLKKP